MLRAFKLLIILSIITVQTSAAQKAVNQYDANGKRHGLWTKNYKDTDQIRYSGVFNHGKEIDTFRFYSLSEGKSVLSATRIFSIDSDLAEVSFFTSTGGLISKGSMRGKTYIGEWTFYHKNSEIPMIIEHYNTNGELEGERKVFYKNGQLAEDSTYKQGKLQGEVFWYSEAGKVFKSLTYDQDQLEGPGIYYDANGVISSKGQYTNNKKSGEWLYYKGNKLVKKIDHDTNTVTKIE